MKPKDILIATALIIIFSSLISGCSLIKTDAPSAEPKPAAERQQSAPTSEADLKEIQEKINKAKAAKKEVTMSLKAKKERGTVTVKITLANPKQKPITSVQTWLSFDPGKLHGSKVDTANTDFSLMAPYDNTFDDTNGLVMIGRSNPDPLTSTSITVAEVVFDIVDEGTTMIDVYDYRRDLSGHASVNALVDGTPFNVLVKPESPALIIEN